MAKAQDKRRQQIREARLNIVAKMYLRQKSYREIRAEVMKRLDLATYSLRTVKNDIEMLLNQWREARIDDADLAVSAELERIDETCRELWSQWEKSKEDYISETIKDKASVSKKKGADGKPTGENTATPYHSEKTRRNVAGLGNVAYISEIRAQLAERRKLLGLYAPEKKSVSGEVSFASFLMESGMLDQAEQSIADGNAPQI